MALSTARAVENHRRVRKERKLVLPGDVFVNVGDKVTPESVIARTELDIGRPLKLLVTPYFGIKPDKMNEVLSVNIGDEVQEGQEIASYKKNALSKRKVLVSPYTGIIDHISAGRGEVMIREKFSEEQSLVVVDVAKPLNVSPFFVKTFMHVREGDQVTYNQIIASLDGFALGAVRSSARGTVEKICRKTGTVSIRRPYNPITVSGYISGEVTEVIPKMGAIIETTACHIEGVYGVGDETYGKLLVLVEKPNDIITARMIKEKHADHILVGGAGIEYEALLRARDMHVRGIILGGMSNNDISRFVGQEITGGITGQEEMDFAVVATEGFGNIPMLEKTFNLLKANEGRMASMCGATQIRAGVIRPEIVIPIEGDNIVPTTQKEAKLVEPKIGMKVRVMTEPYFGAWGTIVADELERVTLSTGVSCETIRVRLENGREINALENNVIVYEVV